MVAPMPSSTPTTPVAPATGSGKAARASRTGVNTPAEPCFSDVLKAEGSKAAQAEENTAEVLAGALGVAPQSLIQAVINPDPGEALSSTALPASAPHHPTCWQGVLVEGEPASQGMEAAQPTDTPAPWQPSRNANPGSASPVQPVDQPSSQNNDITSTQPATSEPMNAGQTQPVQPVEDHVNRPNFTPLEGEPQLSYPVPSQATRPDANDPQRGSLKGASEEGRLPPENPPALEPIDPPLPDGPTPAPVIESERKGGERGASREPRVDRAGGIGQAEVGGHRNPAPQPAAPAEQAQIGQVQDAVPDPISVEKPGEVARVEVKPPVEAQPVAKDDLQADGAVLAAPYSGQSFQPNSPQAPEPTTPAPDLSSGSSTQAVTPQVEVSSEAAPQRENIEAPQAGMAKTTTPEDVGSQPELPRENPAASPRSGLHGRERVVRTDAPVSTGARQEPGKPVRPGASLAGQPETPAAEPPGPRPGASQGGGRASRPGVSPAAPAGSEGDSNPVETPLPVEAVAPQAAQRLGTRPISLPREKGNNPRSNEIVAQLANPVATLVHSRRPTLRVQLNPENLGHIELRLTSTAHGVGVTLIPEQSATGRLLENQLNHLRQALSDAGVQLNSLNIGSGSSPTSDGNQWQPPANPERSASTRPHLKEDLSNSEPKPSTRHETSQIDYRI